MKTFFQSTTPVFDDNGKVIAFRGHIYIREQPKVNHQAAKAKERREQHKFLTEQGVPRSQNGQRLGLRKRTEIFTHIPF